MTEQQLTIAIVKAFIEYDLIITGVVALAVIGFEIVKLIKK